ncbi:hypothetical protein [Nitratireductor sp. ZSWI3]|uniref:hypothetical protein n=1 Tax=Nitratireductor sp. ZSWI3 TaxID=2966359 RepID=UPI00214FEBF2|nr:hypothetical protein [Nitratireductor sp. ZSWI3]MCR4265609.1 hypothetical protein [Nitratireductor sp. ZSWI3]
MPFHLIRAALAGSALLPLFAIAPAHAQPAPSFRATCADLRARLDALEVDEDAWVVIDVVGTLRAVQHDGTLGYMLACEAPDPQVLCITYQVDDYQPSDEVVLSGTLNRIDNDHVSLDPCLHQPPDAEWRDYR